MCDDEFGPKIDNVQALIEDAWNRGKVHIDSTVHAAERAEGRDVDDMDVREVILYGSRDEEEDRWRQERGHWAYALRNRDVDGRDIRIIFDIEQHPDVVIITIMHVYP